MFIIGITTGRCGSMSFAAFMNNQKKTTFTHEHAMQVTTWPVFEPYTSAMKTMRGYGGKYKGDISPGWCPWAVEVLRKHPKATKIVWLHRDPKEVAESFIRQKEYKLGQWIRSFDGDDGFLGAYPVQERVWSYAAVHRCIDRYFWLCKVMNTLYSDFVFPLHISELNSEEKQMELLTWIGYKPSEMRLGMPHLNKWSGVADGERKTGQIGVIK